MIGLEVGSIVQVDQKYCDTGFIKIVGDSRHCPPNPYSSEKWELLAIPYDPERQDTYGVHFDITEKEVEEWRV